MKAIRAISLASLALVCVSAFAQWQWLDRDGRKVFSDRAPPPDIPEKSILKRPGKLPALQEPVQAPDSTPTAAAPVAPLPAPKKTELDSKLEEKKKQAEQAEAAKRKAELDQYAKTKAENCSRAKQAKATMDSGIRIARTTNSGERELMDESARAAEAKRIQAAIDSECK